MELLLMRHAKSDWHQGVADFDRPLNDRGVESAVLMGKLLREQDMLPDHIICSGAKRAQETARGVVQAADYVGDVTVSNRLYLCDLTDFIGVIRKYGGANNRLMVIAHNPGTEHFIAHLTGEHKRVTTGNIAKIELPLSVWADFTPQTKGELIGFWRPREPRS